MPRMKITKGAVDRLPHPEKGQRVYSDTALTGFGVLVGKRTKTYIAQRDIKGRTVRVTIGRHGVLTTDQARKKARQLIARMADGENPNEARRAEGTTLGEALELYLGALTVKNRSPLTLEGYRRDCERHLGHWLGRPLAGITRKEVRDRHRQLGDRAGPYAANSAMRAFRAIWNRVMREDESLPVCPTINVDWYPERERDSALSPDQLRDWHDKVSALPNPIRRDYYLFVLFTGLRRRSAAEARWEDADLEAATLRVPKPKGGEIRAFTLPLSDFVVALLRRRREENEPFFPDSPWIFPAASKSGHIEEPKEKGLPSPHALRHTYVSVATNRVELQPYILKLLCNHALPRDVTAGYVGVDLEALRIAQQRVTDFLLSCIEPESGERVVRMAGAR